MFDCVKASANFGITKRQQHEDGAGTHNAQQSRISQRRDDIAAQLVPRTLELGQAVHGEWQRSAHFTRTDHAEVEFREMLGAGAQAIGERRSRAQRTKDVVYDGTKVFPLGQFRGDRQSAVERNAGVQQSGNLLREVQYVPRTATRKTGEFQRQATGPRRPDKHRGHSLPAQLAHCRCFVAA